MATTRAMPVEPRLWAKVDKTPTCWLWTGALTRGDYGTISVNGRDRAVHRVAYEILVGPIPDGLQLDHLCGVRRCVNPDHLEPVTGQENTLRGETVPAANAAKTHCKSGHPFTPENTYRTSVGARQCRTCARNRMRAWRATR